MKTDNVPLIIDIKKIKKEYQSVYDRVLAIKNISLKIYEGNKIGICGISGSGKSTLVKIISGIEDITSGTINIYGKNSKKFYKNRKAAYKNIQYIYQNSFETLDPKFKVIDELFRVYKRFNAKDREKFMSDFNKLKKLFGLDRINFSDKLPNEFSGGQLQRIALIRALLVNPKILILDEPTAMLDKISKKYIYNYLNGIENKPKTIIIVTHDLDLIKKCVNRVIKLKDGKIVNDYFTKKP